MSKISLPSVFHERPTRSQLKRIGGIQYFGIALKVARNIHMRCRLGESQNWKCCWCGVECVPEPNFSNSATIEHVQPRSLGGSDDWENLAMACASCNHRRGTMSIEDMMSGRVVQPNKNTTKLNKKQRRLAKMVDKYIKRALRFENDGWQRSDGSLVCKTEWINSLRLNGEHKSRVERVVFKECA